MNLARLFGALSVAIGLAASSNAHAWVKIKNTTSQPVTVAIAFDSVSSTFCGWYDSCPDTRGSLGYRVEGWWTIAPGATATVSGNNWGNALWQIYAYDQYGHAWQGGGGILDVATTAFSKCDSMGGSNERTFAPIRGSRCCGGSCPSNYTLSLGL